MHYVYNFIDFAVAKRLYRVSNNGYTSWRPTVGTFKAYSDPSCSTEISIEDIDKSGHILEHSFLGYSSKIWRPGCDPCEIGEAWRSFSTENDVQCVLANALGKGLGGGGTWNGGIKLEIKDKGSWITVFESTSGNKANGMYYMAGFVVRGISY